MNDKLLRRDTNKFERIVSDLSKFRPVSKIEDLHLIRDDDSQRIHLVEAPDRSVDDIDKHNFGNIMEESKVGVSTSGKIYRPRPSPKRRALNVAYALQENVELEANEHWHSESELRDLEVSYHLDLMLWERFLILCCRWIVCRAVIRFAMRAKRSILRSRTPR